MTICFKSEKYTILKKTQGNITVDTTKVGDEERGYLIFNNKCWDFLELTTYRLIPNSKKKKQTIVLVLESPHVEEFDSNHIPIRPANGVTGANIEYFLKRRFAKLWNLSEDIDYKICIVNAVQFQASCKYALDNKQITLTTDYQKNTVKHYVLYLAFDTNDLKNRLSKHNPDIIVNCCTKTPNSMPKSIKKNIYELVQGAIEEYKKELQGFSCCTKECTHPSSWGLL